MSRRDPRLTLAQIREAAERALLLCASQSLEELLVDWRREELGADGLAWLCRLSPRAARHAGCGRDGSLCPAQTGGERRANYDRIDRDDLRQLADRIWHGAGEEIDRFVEIAMGDEPFPV